MQRGPAEMPVVASPSHQTGWTFDARVGEQTTRSRSTYCIEVPATRSDLVSWLQDNGMGWSESFYTSPGAVEVIFGLYSCRERDRVGAYLESHRGVLPVLAEAHRCIQAYFGSGTPVVLSVIPEPADHGIAELFALIATSLPVEQALAAMRRFDEEWWLDVPEHQS